MVKRKEDFVDKIVAWGCRLLHLGKYTAALQQLAKFVIVGVANTALNWAISFPLYAVATLSPLWTNAIAFAISSIFNFWASTTWVFNTTNKKSRRRLFIEFIAFNGIAFLVFDLGLYYGLCGGNPDLVSTGHRIIIKVITTAFGMVFNFITRKLFLEERQPRKKARKA